MKVFFNVDGMSCSHCAMSIESSVSKLEGVSSVKVDLEAESVAVDFDAQMVSEESIKSTIEDQGYEIV